MRALGMAAALVGLLVCAVPAAADRKPTPAEASMIEAVALHACAAPPGDCAYRRARVSTANERFAWAKVIGEGISGVLLKRSAPNALDFRTVGTQGGGIASCSYWRKRAPRAVLRDLRVRGLVKSGAIRNCGKRR